MSKPEFDVCLRCQVVTVLTKNQVIEVVHGQEGNGHDHNQLVPRMLLCLHGQRRNYHLSIREHVKNMIEKDVDLNVCSRQLELPRSMMLGGMYVHEAIELYEKTSRKKKITC